MHKICLAVFSTNRPEYLIRTLEAQRRLDFAGCEVHRMLFDDMPKDRDDDALTAMVNAHGYEEVYLHEKNLSIGGTWQEFWDLIRNRDYDFVFHQEDDVEILEPVAIADLIEVLRITPKASQVVLKRQPWYPHEQRSMAMTTDLRLGKFRGEFTDAQVFFTPIASLYPMDRVRFDYRAWYKAAYPNDPIFHTANINEALIGKALLEERRLTSLHLKNVTGGNIISHIGEYTIGRKLLPHEPGFAPWAGMDPETKYWSGTRKPYAKPD